MAPVSPVKTGIDVWIEGIDDLREFVDLIEKMSVLAINENDVIVLKVRQRLTMADADELRELVRGVFGETRRILVLDSGVEMAVVSEDNDETIQRLEKASV